MPEKKLDIERYEVIQVKSQQLNQYGDLIFTDTGDKSHKIGNKRDYLYDQIVDGRAVKVGYAIYKNTEYIATAELFDGKPPPEKQVVPITAGVGVPEKQSVKTPQDGAARGMLVKEMGDMMRAGLLTKIFGDDAQGLIEWYKNEVLTISKKGG